MPQLKMMITVLILMTFASCSQDEEKKHNAVDGGENIISNRPNTNQPYVGLVRLKNPALLEAPKFDSSGAIVFDAALAGKILIEQERVISDFKKISNKVEVVYRYRNVLNALAVVVPEGKAAELSKVAGVVSIQKADRFYQPKTTSLSINSGKNLRLIERNSAKHIGASDAHLYLRAKTKTGQLVPLRGQGVRVGVIDTGIDYTHKMLGGDGKPETFKDINPAEENSSFPNSKVIGGYDFVGSNYAPGSPKVENRIPKPDYNPIDESGHGTHVAGTVAGVGDYVFSHDGVAPGAKLYALKVFGRGGTTDAVVIAALEYAVDPDRDMDVNDRLDIVNLSLGGAYGQPYILYTEAVKNATNAGMMVVAAAGNAGANDFIVGAPSTANDAISVAASIDNSYHNWQFDSVRITGPDRKPSFVERIEGPVTKRISSFGRRRGKLFYVGLAKVDLTEEQKAGLKGNIALIDRGGATFFDKLTRAYEAGAIGAVVANNKSGRPVPMGGGGPGREIKLPAIMITLAKGNEIKEMMKKGDVKVRFDERFKIQKPEIIDTITSFSSKGPRSIDYVIKPEIAAPGQRIISAAVGGGSKTRMMGGTSMSSPHIAGALALMRQLHPKLSPRQLKSLLMNGALSVQSSPGVDYPVSMQGAGRVQIVKSALSPIVVESPSISLGQVQVNGEKILSASLKITNISDESVKVEIHPELNSMSMLSAGRLELAANQTIETPISLSIKELDSEEANAEVDGFIRVVYENQKTGDTEELQVPVLAFVSKMSNIELLVSSYDKLTKQAKFTYRNESNYPGDALAFNYLGVDDHKVRRKSTDSHRSIACDLHAAGYRVIKKMNEETKKEEDFIQFGVKLHSAMSSWRNCEVSVQIDRENDGVVEQELVGIQVADLFFFGSPNYVSVLLDAPKVKQIRKEYEDELAKKPPFAPMENYLPGVQFIGSMLQYDYSNLAVIEAPLRLIAKANGKTHVRIATLHDSSRAIESDDFLQDQEKNAMKLEFTKGWTGMSEIVKFDAFQNNDIELSMTADAPQTIVLFTPQNKLSGHGEVSSQVHQLKVKP